MLQGFTLIELAIVLVIIGLIAGGILVGGDLIRAAEVRAQIAQIEKYNSAVITFRGKFGELPGDMPPAVVNRYGFTQGTNCNGTQAGWRNGDGLISGWYSTGPYSQGQGEAGLFWQDITSAIAGNLIEGQFPNSGGILTSCAAGDARVMSTAAGADYIGNYLPAAKLGDGNFVYIYSDSGRNWYGVSAVTSNDVNANFVSKARIPVTQAYNIDKKIDDGLPTSGAVLATYITSKLSVANATNAATDSTATCYNTTSNAYSLSTLANYGAGGNCALSFRFQ